MNQDDVELFLTLVKTKNITKTAESLFISQPTVSHRLQQLENELGVVLINRKKGYKQIELTQKGEEFVPLAERWLALMSETQLLRDQNNKMHLSIGCTDTLNSTIFKGLYQRIIEERMPLDLLISTQYSYVLYENLQDHLIDLGYVFFHLRYKNIITKPILHEKMYLVQEARGAVRKNRVFLSDLDPEKEIYFKWETNFTIWHDQMVTKGKNKSLEADIFTLLAAFLQEPGRWTFAPRSIVDELARHQDIYVCEIEDSPKPPERVTYMITNSQTSEVRQKAISLFEDRMMKYFRELGYEDALF